MKSFFLQRWCWFFGATLMGFLLITGTGTTGLGAGLGAGSTGLGAGKTGNELIGQTATLLGLPLNVAHKSFTCGLGDNILAIFVFFASDSA